MASSDRLAEVFDAVVLQPDEMLLLRPRQPLTPDVVNDIRVALPELLRDRVIVVEPDAFDVLVMRKIG